MRQIARRPLSSTTIIAVLALGIGLHAAYFAVLQSLTVRPAPGVANDPSLVRLRGKERPPQRGEWFPRLFSYPEYLELAARRDLFSSTGAWTTELVTMDLGDPASAVSAQTHFVTDDYFGTAGVRIAFGTSLPLPRRAGGNDGEMVAIIGDALWHDLFGAEPTTVGRMIRVNDARVRIVGIAPPKFNGIAPSSNSRTLWMPLASRAAVLHGTRVALLHRDSALLSGVARLAPGVTTGRASAVIGMLSDRAVARMTPAKDGRERTADVVPLRLNTELPQSNDVFLGGIASGLAGLLVLIMACTNVSALVIGAGVARSQEIAIRLSLGASRARIVRQLLTESCLLAIAGGAVGLAVYAAGVRIIGSTAPDLEIAPDLATAAFTMIFALGTGLLFGLLPALHATRRGVGEILKGGGGSGGSGSQLRLQSSFIVAQIAVTQPLLVGIGLLLALSMRAGSRPIGQSVTNRVIRMRFGNPHPSAELRARFRAAIKDLESMPGVERVTSEAAGLAIHDLIPAPDSRSGLLRHDPLTAHVEGASPGYFAMLDVPIMRGRDIALADTALADRTAVIGSDFAHELWGNADPLGRRLEQFDRGKAVDRPLLVVGVYDVAYGTTRGAGRRIFVIDTGAWRDYSYLVRTAGPARAMTNELRTRLRATVPEMPIARLGTLTDVQAEEYHEILQIASMACGGAALVLLLASIGLYGVVGLTVAQRRREIGIRVALGARPLEVVGLLFRKGLRLGAIGLAIGLPLSILALVALGKSLGTTLDSGTIGASPSLIGVAIASVVLLVTAVATWLPARRAAVVDPMIALRSE